MSSLPHSSPQSKSQPQSHAPQKKRNKSATAVSACFKACCLMILYVRLEIGAVAFSSCYAMLGRESGMHKLQQVIWLHSHVSCCIIIFVFTAHKRRAATNAKCLSCSPGPTPLEDCRMPFLFFFLLIVVPIFHFDRDR